MMISNKVYETRMIHVAFSGSYDGSFRGIKRMENIQRAQSKTNSLKIDVDRKCSSVFATTPLA